MGDKTANIVIIGSGPAGYTAALYAARADLAPIVFAGEVHGGQLMITTEIENFPGFAEGITGPDLMEQMRLQAERFGADIRFRSVQRVDLSQRPFVVHGEESALRAHTIVVATGASARWMGLESEEKLKGYGVSACATCDGFFYRDKEVMVVGGGDSAMEEATFLTKFATKVTIVHRRDEFRASKIMQERARKNERIHFALSSVIEEIHDPAQQKVTGVTLKSTKTGERTKVPCDGVFMAIGHHPNTAFLDGQLETDETGYILTHDGAKTSVEGVFAAGDVQDTVYRQAITAAGTGCMAALDAEHYLEAMEA